MTRLQERNRFCRKRLVPHLFQEKGPGNNAAGGKRGSGSKVKDIGVFIPLHQSSRLGGKGSPSLFLSCFCKHVFCPFAQLPFAVLTSGGGDCHLECVNI